MMAANSPEDDASARQIKCTRALAPEVPVALVEEPFTSDQRAVDAVEEASMESFPCSDPPAYTSCHV